MGLYDGYQLANSRAIPQFRGSVVPDLVQVSGQLQQYYDKAVETNDYTARLINSLQAHPNDQRELSEWSKGYREKINKLSQRPDMENALREVTMLARQVPDEYQKQFGQRVKDLADYSEKLKKDAELYITSGGEKGISPITHKKALAASLWLDKQAKEQAAKLGQPLTRFTGHEVVGEIDLPKMTDEALAHVDPKKYGFEVVQGTDGNWLKKTGTTTTRLTPQEITAITNSYFDASDKYRQYLNQQHLFNTYEKDYSNIDPSQFSDGTVLDRSLRMQNGKPVTDKNGRQIVDTYTATDYIKRLVSKGVAPADAMRQLDFVMQDKANRQKAIAYAQKYVRNDSISTMDISANPFALKKLDDYEIPITAQVLQPVSGFQHDSPDKLKTAIDSTEQATKELQNNIGVWRANNVARQTGPIGDPKTRFYDKNGTDITFDVWRKEDLYKQSAQQLKDLQNRQKQVFEQAGYKPSPQLIEKAEKARADAFEKNRAIPMGDGTTTYDDDRGRLAGQQAYDAVMQNTPGYKRAKQLMAEDAKNKSAVVGVTRFSNKKVNDAIETAFDNLVIGLDKGDLQSGMIGATWAATNNKGQAGTPLNAKDYALLRGKGKFAGTMVDADGQIKMMFKADNTARNTKGDQVGEAYIVKVPAFAGVAESMVKEGMVREAEQYIRQNIGAIDDRPNKSGMISLGPGKDVRVDRIPGSTGEPDNYRLTIPTTSGPQQVSLPDPNAVTSYFMKMLENSAKRR
ncbi:MAG: hypothetical protein HYU71_06375 [Bacteroidetes bacterium]|nr:hypothetical protein [Bacteroidota bacterium]